VKYLLSAFTLAAILSACGPSNHPDTAATTDSVAIAAAPTEQRSPMEARILGTYKGDFGGSPIYITINYCSGNKIAGYNIHKGLRRNISGGMKTTDKGWILTLAEPGDHEFDGAFSLVIDTALSTVTGSWKPSNNPALSEKRLTLTKFQQDGNMLVFLQGDHCDINFEKDGECTLNYYDKINDSTYSQQMITLRGTWEKQSDSTMLVNWKANTAYDKRSTLFTLTYQVDGDEKYPDALTGDAFKFSYEPEY